MKKISYISLCIVLGYFALQLVTPNKQINVKLDFETKLVDGSDFILSKLRGGYVLLDFWGSWCVPCRIDNPKLVALHNKYPKKLTVVSIALEKKYEAAIHAAKADGFTWKNQIIEQHLIIRLSSIANAFGVTEIPTKFLIDPEGNIQSNLSFEEIDSLLSKVD